MTDIEKEINSTQYIEEIIKTKNVKDLVLGQQGKLINSIKIGFKTFFYSKKWLIYLALAFVILPVIILIEGGDLSFKNPDEKFIEITVILFPVIFVFGCLLISLPLSADEISDHSIELYITRPIKREVFWLSRWIVVNIVVYCVNLIIYLFYFLFCYAFAEQGSFVGMGDKFYVFGGVAILLFLATLIYSGTFLLVGMIGTRGLLFGFLFAIFELIIINMIFLSDNPYIPQNNLFEIANDILPDHFDFEGAKDLKLQNAWIYISIFPIVVFVGGALLLRMREIK